MPKQSISTLDFQHRSDQTLPLEVRRLETMSFATQAAYGHRHNFYEIIWVTHGAGTHTIDFVAYPIEPHSLFFLSPGQIHAIQITEELRGFALLFTHDLLALDNSPFALQLLPFLRLGQHPAQLHLTPATLPTLYHTATQMEAEFQARRVGRSEILRSYLHIFLVIASRQMTDEHPQTLTYSRLLVAFLDLVEQHVSALSQVQEYAALLAVTPGHLNDVVRQTIGKTAGEVIRDRIALEAKRLLFHSQLTIAEIASQLGFADPSYFGRFFRRATGESPGEFRQSIREKYQIGR
jgi:AraC family transcriptional regulator, transcriptional activator of pobA